MAKRTLYEWGIHGENRWELYRGWDHYFLYINGEFYCTCDNLREFKEELEAMG